MFSLIEIVYNSYIRRQMGKKLKRIKKSAHKSSYELLQI